MPQLIFVNLPVENIERSRAFYASLGFSFNPQFSDEVTACVVLSDTIFFMIMEKDRFAGFAPNPIPDTTKVTAMLIALSRDSRKDVIAMTDAAVAHGGWDNNKTQEMGDYMYGRSFCDPDGHVIEPMWMDVQKAAAAWGQT